jgi:hypothetical protein
VERERACAALDEAIAGKGKDKGGLPYKISEKKPGAGVGAVGQNVAEGRSERENSVGMQSAIDRQASRLIQVDSALTTKRGREDRRNLGDGGL